MSNTCSARCNSSNYLLLQTADGAQRNGAQAGVYAPIFVFIVLAQAPSRRLASRQIHDASNMHDDDDDDRLGRWRSL